MLYLQKAQQGCSNFYQTQKNNVENSVNAISMKCSAIIETMNESASKTLNNIKGRAVVLLGETGAKLKTACNNLDRGIIEVKNAYSNLLNEAITEEQKEAISESKDNFEKTLFSAEGIRNLTSFTLYIKHIPAYLTARIFHKVSRDFGVFPQVRTSIIQYSKDLKSTNEKGSVMNLVGFVLPRFGMIKTFSDSVRHAEEAFLNKFVHDNIDRIATANPSVDRTATAHPSVIASNLS